MNRKNSGRIVGFDRKIRLEWLDAAAAWTAEGCSASEVRARLDELLDGTVSGVEAKAKTITVLIHVWHRVPAGLDALRDDGTLLLAGRKRGDRILLHWGMCLATYPFFRSVAAAAGKLTAVQGTASLAQITRRVTERWGERSTVTRAVQRVVRSFVLWGVLADQEDRGVFALAPKVQVPVMDPVGPWLLEAAFAEFGGSPRPLDALRKDPALFPFLLEVTATELAGRPGIEVHRQGMDEELVVRAPPAGRAR